MIESDVEVLIMEIEAGYAAAEYARREEAAQQMLESLTTENGEIVRRPSRP